MKRGILAFAIVAFMPLEANAQSWFPWDQPGYRSPYRQGYGYQQRRQPSWWDDEDEDERRPRRPQQAFPRQMDGGGRPSISPMPPQSVGFRGNYSAGSIVIDTAARRLYLVQGGNRALMYPVSVGREGFAWTGTQRISRVADWPDWRPPAEMREREPHLPEIMTGGIRNPLGAKALYLGNTLYRIHGTNSAQSIGRAGSSGCFRMLNGHVVDLAGRVGVGTTVHVVARLPGNVAQLNAN